MATFDLIVYVEGIQADVGPAAGDQLLGRLVNVAIDNWRGPGTPVSEKALLLKLLCPWNWTIGWADPPTPLQGVATPTPATGGLKAALEQALDDILDTDDVSRLALVEQDDGAQAAPRWPALLAQLQRSNAQVSHHLRLAHVGAYAAAAAPDLGIQNLKVDNVTYPVGVATHGVTLDVRMSPTWPRNALANQPPIGLIDRLGRQVVFSEDARANWLAQLPARLGRAIDPIPRLTDFAEVTPLSQAAFLKAAEIALDALLAPLALAGPLQMTMLTQDGAPADSQVAADWATAMVGRLPALRNALLANLLPDRSDPSLEVDAEDLRGRYGGAAADAVADELLATLPDFPKRSKVAAWLGEPTARKIILQALLPNDLARVALLPPLTDAAAASAMNDLGPLGQAFQQVFAGAFGALTGGLSDPAFDPVMMELAREVFREVPDGADDAAANGLAVRLDTVFHRPDPALPDMHMFMEGALIAVQPYWTGQAGELPWSLVTFGAASLATSAVTVDLGPVVVPYPVAFEGSWQGDTAGDEIRHAIASYHGSALIPQDAPRPPPVKGDGDAPPADPADIGLLYKPVAGNDPLMAYGRDYRVAAGYSAPGGILPQGFCQPSQGANPADPYRFAPQAAQLADTHWHTVHRLRRSLIPGPPRLLPPNSAPGPLAPAKPGDADVRPLWKDHRACWKGAAATADAERLENVQTVFLDHLRHRERFAFDVRPPMLGLGHEQAAADNAVVWRYWRARDRDFDATVDMTPPYPHTDDPAVVGGPKGAAKGRGGVQITLSRITRSGLARIGANMIRLRADEKVSVEVLVDPTAASPTLSQKSPFELVVRAPPGVRALVEAQTVCDPAFFKGGADERFGSEVVGADVGGLVGFGRSALVFETLPELDHLPTAKELSMALVLGEDPVTGAVEARLKTPSNDDAFDYVGSVTSIRQRWDWDGGPVPELKVFSGDGKDLEFGEAEGAGPARDARFVALESQLFNSRGDAGASETAPCAPGVAARLFRLEPPANRGADYVRCRFTATSRYAALRPSGASREARIGSAPSDRWRGCLVTMRRRDRLPTPGLAIATPLFGRLNAGDQASTAGAIALYLDHGLYRSEEGAGLAEVLQAEVLLEFGPAGGRLAAGLDPIRHTVGDPIWGSTKVPTQAQRLVCSAVLGQTLEPFSAASRMPFALGIFEPRTEGGLELNPDVMAKIRVRTTYAGAADTDPLNSAWSAPLWVHFLPDMSPGRWDVNAATHKREETPLLQCARNGSALTLTANPAAQQMGAARLARLKSRVQDNPSGGPVHLVDSLWAVVVSTVRDIAGDEVIRTREIVHASLNANDQISFPLGVATKPSYVRLLELQRRRGETTDPANIRESTAPQDASRRLFGALGASGQDVPERIVAIGPLIAVQ